MIKRRIFCVLMLVAILLLSACGRVKKKTEYLCEYISFERSNSNILIGAMLCKTENADEGLKNMESEYYSASAKSVEPAFSKFKTDYRNVLYKTAKAIVLSDNLTDEDKKELCRVFMNDSSLPLKCEVHIPRDISCTAYIKLKPSDSEVTKQRLTDWFFENAKAEVTKE